MEFISHDDRLLKEHLAGLKKVSEQILPEKNQSFFSSEELKEKVFALVAYHDLAKASVYFQLYLSYALLGTGKEHRDYSKEDLQALLDNNTEYIKEWKDSYTLNNYALYAV